MGAQLSTQLTLQGAEQHNEALRSAAQQLSQYRREVNQTDKELKKLRAQSQTATGSIQAFASSFKSGNIDGMLISGANAAKMFTKSFLGIAGIATAGASIGSWLNDAVQQGVELAKQGEGIRIAFERINTPGLLNNLREATHNTVTDLELMKQAVKFNDFNLDIEQLGTYLAFAQQKAKDTGQSVDYLVDSIVTGLGRQSPQILDNLGISAAEIKKQMKAGGDMTTAVANIIKNKMQEAGDYVETAADRAAKKETELQNAYEELGRTFGPLTEAAGGLFHSIQVGAIKAINALRPLIDMLTTAGQLRQAYEGIGGSSKVKAMLDNFDKYNGDTKKQEAIFRQQKAAIQKYISAREGYINALDKWRKGDRSEATKNAIEAGRDKYGVNDKELRWQVKGANQMLNEYVKGVETAKKKATTLPAAIEDTKKSGKSSKHEEVFEAGSIGYIDKEIEKLQKKYKRATTDALRKSLQSQIKELQELKEILINPDSINVPKIPAEYKQLVENINNVLKAYDVGAIGSEKAKELIAGFNGEISKMGLKPIKVKIDTEVIQEAKQLTDSINDVIESYNIGAIGYDKANELIGSINKQLKEIGLRPVRVHLDTEVVKEAKILMDNVQQVLMDYDMGIIGYEQAKQLIDGFNNKIKELGLRPVTTQLETDVVRTGKQLMDDINKVIEQHDMGAISTKKARELINGINTQLKQLKLDPVRVDIEPKGLEKMKQLNSDIGTFVGAFNGIDSVKNSVEGLVESFSEGANAWDIFMGALQTGEAIMKTIESTMSAVALVQELLGTTAATTAEVTAAAGATEMATAAGVTTAKSGEAIASATAEGAKMPFPLNLVAIAAGVAAVIAALGMITGAFADGGIVGGSSYSGDKLYARVNSGEMILNGRQQRNLFNAINSGNIGGGGAVGGNVVFTIKGRKLVGVLNNENDKMKKVR